MFVKLAIAWTVSASLTGIIMCQAAEYTALHLNFDLQVIFVL